jgi:hypothetical protein
MRPAPEIRVGNLRAKPAGRSVVELSIADAGDPAVAWLDRGEAAMLANMLALFVSAQNMYDPLASLPDGGESGQLAKAS